MSAAADDVVARVRAVLGGDLRSLSMFGSCLAASTRAPERIDRKSSRTPALRAGAASVPDLFAVVEDAPAAARAFGVPAARVCWYTRS